jgi:hypothetical protein
LKIHGDIHSSRCTTCVTDVIDTGTNLPPKNLPQVS